MKVSYVGKIIFKQHPGDLLEIIDLEKHKTTITIGNIKLILTGGIKLTPEKYFLVSVEFPTDKIRRTSLIEKLNHLKLKGEIQDYSV